MDSLRDVIFEDLAERSTNTEVNTAGIGRYYTFCPSVEVPDGIIAAFTFKEPVALAVITVCPDGCERVYVDGTLQARTTDYTFNGATATVTFAGGSIPVGGQVVTADLISIVL